MLSKFKQCKIYLQKVLSVYFLVSCPLMMCLGSEFSADESEKKKGRSPANFVPDDDVIIVPLVIEKSFIDEFHDKHKNEFNSARKTLRHWISQEQYAKDYGLENTGIVRLPTIEEKERFLQRNYLRFISKDVEKTTNSGIKNKLEEWTADDEIDAITTLELHEKVIVRAKKSKGKKDLKATKSLKVGKDQFKFGFHPRPEIGMLKFTVDSKFFNARAWLGANGNQEIKIERKFQSTNTKAFVNCYVDQTRILAAVDQKLSPHWVFRLTHVKDFDDFSEFEETTHYEDNIAQLRFHYSF